MGIMKLPTIKIERRAVYFPGEENRSNLLAFEEQ